MSDSAPRLVYMTTANRDEAQRLGAMLVKERLAACVNILDGMTSMFWWENAVQSDSETVLIAKTRADLVPRLTERVKATHSYECPCVVSLALDGGNPEFLAWIQTETEAAEE